MMHQNPPEARQSADKPATYPDVPGVRKGAPGTSQEAATEMAPHLGRLQKATREAIQSAGHNGLTADEAAAVLGLERWTVQPRLSELKAKGLIVDSGQRRKNITGKRAVVWIAAELLADPMAEAA